jgi:ribonuclease Z
MFRAEWAGNAARPIMGVRSRVLGEPFEDNSVYGELDTGSGVRRILVDTGEGVGRQLDDSEVLQLDGVAFSHFHMDHIAGFDSLFRRLFTRAEPEVHVWGPRGAIEVLHHRFLGFTWNLVKRLVGEWVVHEVEGERVRSARFRSSEGFAHRHYEGTFPFDGVLATWDEGRLEAIELDHKIPVLGYKLVERRKRKVDRQALEELGLEPGPWLGVVLAEKPGYHPEAAELLTPDGWLMVNGERMLLPLLRRKLLRLEPGGSLGVLTDFHLASDEEEERLARWLEGVHTLVCECHFRDEDEELARRTAHMHASAVGSLAARAGVERLVLHHVSGRYRRRELPEILAQVRQWIPESGWPEGWQVREGAGSARSGPGGTGEEDAGSTLTNGGESGEGAPSEQEPQ